MKFTYELNGIGWADATLELNDKVYHFFPSYITEALSDLVKSIEVLMPECVAEDEVKCVSTFTWNSEPSGDVWTLTRKNESILNIKIKSYPNGIKVKKHVVLLNENCKFDDFVKEIVISMDKILIKHGLVGYRRQWYRGEFPLSGHLMLKHYLMRTTKINVQILNLDEVNKYLDSNLMYELDLIKSKLE